MKTKKFTKILAPTFYFLVTIDKGVRDFFIPSKCGKEAEKRDEVLRMKF
jgi:hypothetical protein